MYVFLHETPTIWTMLEYAAIVLISPALLVCIMGIVAFAGLLVAKSK